MEEEGSLAGKILGKEDVDMNWLPPPEGGYGLRDFPEFKPQKNKTEELIKIIKDIMRDGDLQDFIKLKLIEDKIKEYKGIK